jgi:hypothetical protein
MPELETQDPLQAPKLLTVDQILCIMFLCPFEEVLDTAAALSVIMASFSS